MLEQLREQAGFTNEELIGIERTTLATGGNLKRNTQSLLYSAKITALNNKVLLNERFLNWSKIPFKLELFTLLKSIF